MPTHAVAVDTEVDTPVVADKLELVDTEVDSAVVGNHPD